MPGWSEFVEPLRDKSLFWHNTWLECDRPKTGVVADIMRRTRAAYHDAIRRIKQNADAIINERFAEAVINNKSRDLWAEVKRIRGCGSCPTNVVDCRDTPAENASFFAKKYQDLYTYVSYDSNCMIDIFCELDDLLAVPGYNENCIFTIL